ncbi:MAG: N-acetylmuramoyl-L-alanine amidase [Vicinamibacteria bacterium]
MKRTTFITGFVIGGLLCSWSSLDASAAQAKRSTQRTPTARAKATPTPKPTPKGKAKVAARPAKAQPTATPPSSRPDRSLYQAALRSEQTLRRSTRLRANRVEWEKAASAYRTVVDRFPRSPYCDDALLKAGDLQREMSQTFKNRKYADQALTSYALIVDEYPGSRLGENALYATYQILTERGEKNGARDAAAKYIEAYPDGRQAKALSASMARTKISGTTKTVGKKVPMDEMPTGGAQFERSETPSRGQVQVYGVRFWSGDASTRIVIDLDRKVEIKQDRLQSPPRLFIDLLGTRLHPNLVGKTFPVGNAFLKQIRVGVNRENVVRIVIDFGEAKGHNVFFLDNPERLVIDVQGEAPKGVRTASTSPVVTSVRPQETMESVEVTQRTPLLPSSTPEEDGGTGAQAPVFASTPEPLETATPAPVIHPTPRLEATPLSTPRATPQPQIQPTPIPSPRPVPTPEATATASPARNHDGNYSLARQLGLGARRICLDAGHGGHDPGAIGRGGTQEKDITLAVVLRLEKLIRKELGADVVMTRDKDIFIPLEERTAIANSSGADLFLSVHINSARNSTGRGLETYYLSFAKNAAAEELAARENAISQATMKDLNNLVKAIANNSKIDESRDFAGIIQKNNVGGLSPDFSGVLDRGVHTAPFYVLIGANMPSILTEVGFISNPAEEKWLKSDAYQEKLAESLLEGVRDYLGQLNRTQTSKLGGRTGVRVPAKSRR